MLFHTWTFALFFLVFYAVYLVVKKTVLRDYWLVAASYAFYATWNPLYMLLVVYSTNVDFFGVWAMSRSRRPKLWLAITLASNVALLSLFKYGGFIAENLNAVMSWMGIERTIASPSWLLPVGLSFYTFQSMSYAIDCYRGVIEREHNFIRYAAFVSLFPQLVAGPIVRAKDLLPQLQSERKIGGNDIGEGLSLFVVGLFKKIALADYLAIYVDKVYTAPAHFTAPALLLATVAFGWQIYFDFSGYTDMARGVAQMLGFRFPWNFNHPYLATSLGDFWARWHISLSTWFRDYVYVPLGGNRKGEAATYRNMCITMLISGLWHGARWTFVSWGALHAAGRVVSRRLERSTFYAEHLPTIFKRGWVYVFVTFTWIFFRARTLEDAWTVVTRIFTTSWVDPASSPFALHIGALSDVWAILARILSWPARDGGLPAMALGLILLVWVYQRLRESVLKPVVQLAPVRVAMVIIMILYVALVPSGQAQPFIYFQF